MIIDLLFNFIFQFFGKTTFVGTARKLLFILWIAQTNLWFLSNNLILYEKSIKFNKACKYGLIANIVNYTPPYTTQLRIFSSISVVQPWYECIIKTLKT